MDKFYTSQLKKFRNEKKISQEEISESVNITNEHYSKIETGARNPSLSIHSKLCLELDRPSDCLLNKKRADVFLDNNIINKLKSLDENNLLKILYIMQTLYEVEKNQK